MEEPVRPARCSGWESRAEKGVAIRSGPGSYAGAREGASGMLTGGRAGWVLSREKLTSGCRGPHTAPKATPSAPLPRGVQGPCAVGDLMHVRTRLVRAPGGPAIGRDTGHGPRREVRRTQADDARRGESDSCVVARRLPNKGSGNLRWNCEPTSQPKGREWQPST